MTLLHTSTYSKDCWIIIVRLKGFEPLTFWSVGCRRFPRGFYPRGRLPFQQSEDFQLSSTLNYSREAVQIQYFSPILFLDVCHLEYSLRMQDECKHELERSSCIHCKLPPVGINKTVYVTKGGYAFHNDSKCESLERGQDDAADEGLRNHPINPVGWGDAFNSRAACRTCCSDYYENS